MYLLSITVLLLSFISTPVPGQTIELTGNNLTTKQVTVPKTIPAVSQPAYATIASKAVINAPVIQIPVVAAPVTPGSHTDWMAAAGISPSDYGFVDYIISRESGWNPNATNAYSGAHGLPQALPYSKTGCGWTDAVCQLRWASGYAQRYGGWAGSYAYWTVHHYW